MVRIGKGSIGLRSCHGPRWGGRGALRMASFLALALVLFASCLLDPASALAQCTPGAPPSGGTVNCTGNPSSFATSGLSTLTVNVGPNASFNGPFSASTMNQIDVTSTNSNFQSVTFNAIGLVNFSLTGGNVNNGITITNGGSANVTNSANINQTFTFSGTGNFTLFNTGILNPGLVVTGDGTHSITNSNFIWHRQRQQQRYHQSRHTQDGRRNTQHQQRA